MSAPRSSYIDVPGGTRAAVSSSPVAFLGGAQEMPVGHTSYFTVDLEPGRYLLVSEATSPDEKVSELTVE